MSGNLNKDREVERALVRILRAPGSASYVKGALRAAGDHEVLVLT
jgi:hypothetical protein